MTVSLDQVLDLGRGTRLAILGDEAAARRVLFALAHAIAARGDRVVTLALDRFRVPSDEECEACVADAHVEVAYRDTIERLKYFSHVHTGIGGRGGFVTTRTATIGRFYSPTPDGLVAALVRNPAMPFVLLHAGRADAGPPETLPSGIRRLLLVEGERPLHDEAWQVMSERLPEDETSTRVGPDGSGSDGASTEEIGPRIVALARGDSNRAARILAAAPGLDAVARLPESAGSPEASGPLGLEGLEVRRPEQDQPE